MISVRYGGPIGGYNWRCHKFCQLRKEYIQISSANEQFESSFTYIKNSNLIGYKMITQCRLMASRVLPLSAASE